MTFDFNKPLRKHEHSLDEITEIACGTWTGTGSSSASYELNGNLYVYMNLVDPKCYVYGEYIPTVPTYNVKMIDGTIQGGNSITIEFPFDVTHLILFSDSLMYSLSKDNDTLYITAYPELLKLELRKAEGSYTHTCGEADSSNHPIITHKGRWDGFSAYYGNTDNYNTGESDVHDKLSIQLPIVKLQGNKLLINSSSLSANSTNLSIDKDGHITTCLAEIYSLGNIIIDGTEETFDELGKTYSYIAYGKKGDLINDHLYD